MTKMIDDIIERMRAYPKLPFWAVKYGHDTSKRNYAAANFTESDMEASLSKLREDLTFLTTYARQGTNFVIVQSTLKGSAPGANLMTSGAMHYKLTVPYAGSTNPSVSGTSMIGDPYAAIGGIGSFVQSQIAAAKAEMRIQNLEEQLELARQGTDPISTFERLLESPNIQGLFAPIFSGISTIMVAKAAPHAMQGIRGANTGQPITTQGIPNDEPFEVPGMNTDDSNDTGDIEFELSETAQAALAQIIQAGFELDEVLPQIARFATGQPQVARQFLNQYKTAQ